MSTHVITDWKRPTQVSCDGGARLIASAAVQAPLLYVWGPVVGGPQFLVIPH